MSVALTIKAALAAAQRDVDAVRDRIAKLRADREDVENKPRDRKHVEALLDAAISEATSPFTARGLASPNYAPHEALANLRRHIDVDTFATLAAFDAKRLKALILADAPAGISEIERTAELARIDAEIEVAEIAEELALREIDDAAGVRALRREDATIAIVLAPTHELEGASR
jgi:hypothetical protein